MMYRLKKILMILFGVEDEINRRVWLKLNKERDIMVRNWIELLKERDYYRRTVEAYEQHS